jgi:hypothetical protein
MSVHNIHINPPIVANGRFSTLAQYGFEIIPNDGQSNMISRPDIRPGIDDDYSAIAGRVFQFGYHSQQITDATNPLDHVNEIAGDMSLGIEYAKAIFPFLPACRKILLVPIAQGGTSFAAGNHNPGDPLYNSGQSRIAAAFTAAAAAGGVTNRMHSYLWLQGESDADAGASAANLYRPRIQARYDHMLANTVGFSSTVPFICGTIKPDKPNASIINSALFDFAAANDAVRCVDLRDLSFYDDNHYDAPSVAKIGLRFAGAL